MRLLTWSTTLLNLTLDRSGRREERTGRWLIGADGASSTVRKWTGIAFEGFTYPERFLTLSTDYPVEAHC